MAWIKDWSQFSGAPSANDEIMGTDVSDTSMAAEGTHKRLPVRYIVVSSSGDATNVSGGGTIALNGHTLAVESDGMFDLGGFSLILGGNFTTDGVVSILGAALTLGGKTITLDSGALSLSGNTLTLTSDAPLNLNGKVLTLTTGDLSMSAPAAGASLALSSDAVLDLSGFTLTMASAGSLDLSGHTITSDGDITVSGTTVTVGGQSFDLVGGTAGADNTLAAWDTNRLVASNISQDGTGNLTINVLTGTHTLVMETGGTLDLNNQKLILLGTGTLDLGLSRTLEVKEGDITLKGGGGEIQLNGNNLVVSGTGNIELQGNGGKLDLNGYEMYLVDGGVNIFGGPGFGDLRVGSNDVTFAKSGTVAMTDDLGTHWGSPAGPFGPVFQLYSNPDSGHNPNAWTRYDAGFGWTGSVYGSQPCTLWFGGRVTGTGTGHIRVVADSTGVELTNLTIQNLGGAYQLASVSTTLPATDESYYFQAYTSTSGTYIYCTSTWVSCP